MRSSLSFLLASFALLASLNPAAHAQINRSAEDRKAETLLQQMTLEEKIDLLGGGSLFSTTPIRRLNIPAFYMSDGPVGAHVPPPSTAMAGGIGLAATWDQQLAREVGVEIGREAKSRGASYLLGPGVNIYRAPLNGRNFEYFGEDPFLAARISVGYIDGIQSQNVAATIKHYLVNNSEYARDTSNSIVGERALREIYLPAFEAGVKEAHVAAVMDSYNLINGEHATENPYFNTTVLRKQWAFDGVLMSDWGAVHSAVPCVNSGLDLEMPFGDFMSKKNLLPAVKQGKVSVGTIDEHVRRILRIAARFGWLDATGPLGTTDLSIPRYDQEARMIALRGALEGAVLLKNDNQMLPLDRTKAKTIAVLGPDAWPAVGTGGGSGEVPTFNQVSIMEGISNSLGLAGTVTYARAIPSVNQVANNTSWSTTQDGTVTGITLEKFENDKFRGQPLSSKVEKHLSTGDPLPTDPEKVEQMLQMSGAEFKVVVAGDKNASFSRWTGFYTAAADGVYDVVALDGVKFRLSLDGHALIDNSVINRAELNEASLQLTAGPHKIVFEELQAPVFGSTTLRVGVMPKGQWVTAYAKALAAKADVVVLALGFDRLSETEGGDRAFGLPAGQVELIREIADVNKNLVVSLTAGGAVDVSPWIDRVPALLQNWYPGQEGGTAFASLLFGDVSPSGRLPISWERTLNDNPSIASYYPKPGTLDISYDDGIWVGYRGYDHQHKQPLFPFGYGLSYSTFEYSNLKVTPATQAPENDFFVATFDIKNTGNKPAAEVAQLYIAPPSGKVERPEKELKGFARVELQPGESKHVEIPLQPRSFTYFDTDKKAWHAEVGSYTVRVGHDSANTALQVPISLATPINASVEESRP